MWIWNYYTWHHKLIIWYCQHPKKLPKSEMVSLYVLLWLLWAHTASEPITTALTHNFYYTYSRHPKHPPPPRLGAVIKSNGSQLGLNVIGQECRLGREATGLFHTTSAGGRSGRGSLARTGARRASALSADPSYPLRYWNNMRAAFGRTPCSKCALQIT